MIEAIATVERWQQGELTISWRSQTACGGCEQEDDCGSGVVAKAFAPKENRLTIPSSEAFAVGTQLKVGITEQDLLQISAAVYLLPLLCGIGAALLAQASINTEVVTISASLMGGFGGWWVARRWAASKPKPVIILGQLGQPVANEALTTR